MCRYIAVGRSEWRPSISLLVPWVHHFFFHFVKGWVQVNALRLSRASIDIEDTTTSTCWGSKSLWSQLLSFLLNLWVLPLVAIGTWGTQGLRENMTLLCENMTLLCGLLGGSVRPIPCPVLCLWHAERECSVRPDSPAMPTAQKTSHSLSQTGSAANMAAPTDS